MRINLTMIHSDTIEEYETTHSYTPEKKGMNNYTICFQNKKRS